MKMYFKGSSGIIDPVDCNGDIIKEGDILTFEWFNKDLSNKFKGWSSEQIELYINEPVFLVKINKDGGLFGEDIDTDRCLYCHDFRFKYCKIVKQDYYETTKI